MAMTVKVKLLLVWILALVVIGFAAHHFLNGAVCAMQNLIATDVACIPGLAKLGALYGSAHA
jgi:predicted nucleotidyltransferase